MAMASLLRAIVLLAFVCYAVGYSCRFKDSDRRVNTDSEKCSYKKFKGPIGSVIASFRPSQISKVTVDQTQLLLQNFGKVLAHVPVVGSVVGEMFTTMADLFFETTGQVVNRIVKELQNEIMALKNYVDSKVQELEYTQLTQLLRGMLTATQTCADYDKPDQMVDLERCLISLNTRIVGSIARFMPSTTNIIATDWVLPLFRQYAALQLTVTMDLLRLSVHLKKKSAQSDYSIRLQKQAQNFYDYSKTSIEKLVKGHSTFPGMRCKADIEWWNPSNPFTTMRGYYGTCTQTFFGNRVCVEKIIVPVKDARNGPDGRNKATVASKGCVSGHARHVITNLVTDLNKYWKLELLDVADKWRTMASQAKKFVPRL